MYIPRTNSKQNKEIPIIITANHSHGLLFKILYMKMQKIFSSSPLSYLNKRILERLKYHIDTLIKRHAYISDEIWGCTCRNSVCLYQSRTIAPFLSAIPR